MKNARALILPLTAGLTLLLLAGCGKGEPDFKYAVSDRFPLMPSMVDRADVALMRPSPGDVARIQRLAQAYRRSGQGKIVIFLPSEARAISPSALWVRQELVAQGVGPHHIQWDIRPLPQGIVRVAFLSNSGRIAHCTNMHEDVQQREGQTSWLNREIYNFGCAYQSNITAQLDNRGDLLQPRAEGPMDPVRVAETVRRRRTAVSTDTNNTPPASGSTP